MYTYIHANTQIYMCQKIMTKIIKLTNRLTSSWLLLWLWSKRTCFVLRLWQWKCYRWLAMPNLLTDNNISLVSNIQTFDTEIKTKVQFISMPVSVRKLPHRYNCITTFKLRNNTTYKNLFNGPLFKTTQVNQYQTGLDQYWPTHMTCLD